MMDISCREFNDLCQTSFFMLATAIFKTDTSVLVDMVWDFQHQLS